MFFRSNSRKLDLFFNESGTANGYVPSVGTPAARKAVAASHSTPGYEVNEDDVLLASGCSGAVDLAITALINEGKYILYT